MKYYLHNTKNSQPAETLEEYLIEQIVMQRRIYTDSIEYARKMRQFTKNPNYYLWQAKVKQEAGRLGMLHKMEQWIKEWNEEE